MASIARNTLVLAVAKTFSVAMYSVFGLFISNLVTLQANGVYSLMSALLFFGGIMTMFGVNLVVVRGIARDPGQAGQYYVDARSALLGGTLLSCVGIFGYMFWEMWVQDSFDPTRLVLCGLVCGILIFDALGTVGEAVCQGFEAMEFPAAVEIVTGMLRAGGALATLWWLRQHGLHSGVLLEDQDQDLKLYAIFVLFLLGSMARGLLLPWVARRRFVRGPLPASSLRGALELLRQSVWIALFQMLRMMRNRLDILLLGVMVPAIPGRSLAETADDARGIFSQAMRVLFVFHTFTLAFNTAIFPRMSRLTQDPELRDDARRQYVRQVAFQNWWSVPMAAVIFLYAPQIAAFFGDKYLGGVPGLQGTTVDVLRIVVFAMLLDSIGGPVGMVIIGLPGLLQRLPLLGLVLAGVSLGINLALIPRYGILGACYASVAASAVEIVLKALFVRKLLKQPWAMVGTSLPFLLLAAALAGGLLLTPLRAHPVLGGAAYALAWAGLTWAFRLVDPAVSKRVLGLAARFRPGRVA